MSKFTTIGPDLAQNVFPVHGTDGAGRAVLRKKLRRAQVLEVFSQLPSCVVAVQACGGTLTPAAVRSANWAETCGSYHPPA